MKVGHPAPGMVMTALGCLALLWVPTARAQIKLEQRFPQSTKLTYKTRSKTRQVLTLMGKEIESEEDKTTIVSRTIGKRRGDSCLPVEERIESLRCTSSFPDGGNVNYNSSNHSFKTNNPELAFLSDVFKLVSETAYTVVLDAKNKVKAIEGTAKLLKESEKLDENVRDLIKSHFDSQKLKTKFEQALQILPEVVRALVNRGSGPKSSKSAVRR